MEKLPRVIIDEFSLPSPEALDNSSSNGVCNMTCTLGMYIFAAGNEKMGRLVLEVN